MDHLWTLDHAATVREVHDALAASRELAYTTVMTVLDRLARKGMVEQQRSGRAYLYRPAMSRDQLTAEVMHEALDTVDDTDRAAVLVRFIDSASPDDAAALRAALAEVERRAASGTR